MLPRVRGLAPGAMRWVLAAALAGGSACDDDGDGPGDPAAEPSRLPSRGAAPAESWSTRLQQPSVDDLLAALAQPHATLRDRLGPHQLQTTADFSLVPSGPPPAEHPPLDQPVVRPQQLHDELTLRFVPDPAGLRASLRQANDHERGREVVVADETIHVRKAHREWFHYPRDSDLIEQWLDDAQRSVHDVVQLAAPRLALTAAAVDGAGVDGAAAVEITLGLADGNAAERVAAGPTQRWRAGAQIDAITGTVRLDAQSGAWLHADVDVRYRVKGADGRELAGHVHLTGRVTLDPSLAVQPPAESAPLPSRLRYDHEQRELLRGLAAP